MSHAYFKNFRKLWNSGKYSSKRELYNAIIQEVYNGVEPTDETTLWLIKRECDAVVQTNGKSATAWIWHKHNEPYISTNKKKK